VGGGLAKGSASIFLESVIAARPFFLPASQPASLTPYKGLPPARPTQIPEHQLSGDWSSLESRNRSSNQLDIPQNFIYSFPTATSQLLPIRDFTMRGFRNTVDRLDKPSAYYHSRV